MKFFEKFKTNKKNMNVDTIFEIATDSKFQFEKGNIKNAQKMLNKSLKNIGNIEYFDRKKYYIIAKTQMELGFATDANITMLRALERANSDMYWSGTNKCELTQFREFIEEIIEYYALIVGVKEAEEALEFIIGKKDQSYNNAMEGINKIKKNSNIKSNRTNLIDIFRGFEIIGGTFIYKVKVLNNFPYRINDVKIQVISYPNDCLKVNTTERTVSKIEPNGGFRSLEFKFTPTHDCVQGVVNSLVTYIDSTETLQTQVVEPIVIKSVCDLLKPLEGSKYEVLDIIDKLKAGAQDELTIAGSASEMFQRFLDVLPDRNFAITDSDSKEVGGRFMGDITAAARGKYTNESIGLKITVLDNGDGGCTVHFKACGNDQSMLPTAVEEVKQILDTKALLVMNIMRTLNVIREACRVDTAHSVLLKLEELKVKIDGEVEPSTIEKLEEVMGIKAMYDSIEEQLKDHDLERICVYCDHLEGMLETGLVKK